jgi:hypothetical protein
VVVVGAAVVVVVGFSLAGATVLGTAVVVAAVSDDAVLAHPDATSSSVSRMSALRRTLLSLSMPPR